MYLTYICIVSFCLADVAKSQFQIINDYNKEDDIKEIRAELRQLHKAMRMVLRRIGKCIIYAKLFPKILCNYEGI